VSADAQWCGQCYLPRGRAAHAPIGYVATSIAVASARHMVAKETLNPTVSSRWRKSQTTFGPTGRVIASVLLVIPFVVFVAVTILTGGLCIIGAVVWGGFIMPMGLRDVWKVAQIPTT
jgi:hypothetical protein